jgi:hypothetical protein
MARVPVYPLLLAAYPILALFAQNAHQVRAFELTVPIAAAVVGAVAAWLAFGLLLRGAAEGAAVTVVAILLFYSMEAAAGWASDFLSYASGVWVRQRIEVGPGWVLVPEATLLVAAIAWAARGARGLGPLTRWLNTMAVIATLLAVVPILQAKVPFRWRPDGSPPVVPIRDAEVPVGARSSWHPTPLAALAAPAGSRPPDLYYIILDGYARQDVMKSHFDFDNSAFLEHLEGLGFYVARNSPANYCQTVLSLSSSLNGVYLDEMVKDLEYDQTTLKEFIVSSRMLASLRPLGYRLVTFATGFYPTDHPEADRYLTSRPYTSEFRRMAIAMTPLRCLSTDPLGWEPLHLARERIHYIFDHLPEIARDPRPTFTLAHVICPHPPMIFGPNGEDLSRTKEKLLVDTPNVRGHFGHLGPFRRYYRDQATYVTKRIQQAIDRILAESPEPPIIIVQSDHGSELYHDQTSIAKTDLHERMSILNAYYFPGRRYEQLYDSISPVNSFRVVFNTVFGAHLPLLPDRSYFSTGLTPYGFIDVTDAVRPNPHDPNGPGKSEEIKGLKETQGM